MNSKNLATGILLDNTSQNKTSQFGKYTLFLIFMANVRNPTQKMQAKKNKRQKRINKGPKGPHIGHLSTMCHLYWHRRDRHWQDDHLVFPINLKNQTWYMTLRSCFLPSFVEFRSADSEEKLKMSLPIRDQDGQLVFQIGLKDTNFVYVEGFEILLPIKFRWNPFSGFRGEVEYVPAIERLGAILFFRSTRKHKLGIERWELASYQVSLNSIQRFQRKSRKCLSQSETRAAILFFRSAQKYKLGRGHWDPASFQVSLNFVQRFQRSRKCEKLTMDDGQRVMTIVHFSRRFRFTKTQQEQNPTQKMQAKKNKRQKKNRKKPEHEQSTKHTNTHVTGSYCIKLRG